MFKKDSVQHNCPMHVSMAVYNALWLFLGLYLRQDVYFITICFKRGANCDLLLI